MKEKGTITREDKKKKHHKIAKKRNTSSSNSDSDEWVEKRSMEKQNTTRDRDDWMSMTGMIKTYSRDDVKPKMDEKEKRHIDSYNPATSSRELNPYWKDGGSGLPQTSQTLRDSRPFIKPNSDSPGYYKKSYYTTEYNKPQTDSYDSYKRSSTKSDRFPSTMNNTSNWRKGSDIRDNDIKVKTIPEKVHPEHSRTPDPASKVEKVKSKYYLSDEKMNKLAAKIVKSEIMGDTKVVNDLKAKLDAARQYRKDNPGAGQEMEEDEGVLLIATSSTGNSRPLNKSSQSGDPRSKGGKRKAETHRSGERMKYFGNDDKYSLGQMFEEEKYGNNFDDEAQLAKIAAKHKNPNDDLEDIFTDEISKNVNAGKQDEREKQRAIKEHTKIERSLEGCEYCVDSKNMLKHLMVSCGDKVYMALPGRKSLVKGQCLITTIQHSTCVTSLDEDVWEEILNYRKAITQYFNSQDKDVVFYEIAMNLHRYPHMVIYCVPLPRDIGDTAPIYFKKALLECEAEWSMNKKVVDLKGKDIRKGIPKGLPYFWVDFGMNPGFAHVIEDQQLFPRNFAEEIIGGILDIDHSLWKNPHRDRGDDQRRKVLEFVQEWNPFDTVNKR